MKPIKYALKQWAMAMLPVLGMLPYAISANAASFDCHKAGTWVEKIICTNPELSKLDNELDSWYKQQISDGLDLEYKRREQRQWLTFQRNTCLDEYCLMQEYKERLGIWPYVGGVWKIAMDSEPPSNAFGTFSESRRITMYNSDAINNEDIFVHINELTIDPVPDDLDRATIDSALIFDKGHDCVLSGEAYWWSNHWSLIEQQGDKVIELRLYPATYKGKTQLLLKDFDGEYRKQNCGVRGYFDGLVFEKK